MPFRIIRDDITRVSADAIVNTANPMPVYADGTDHAIYMAAGADELLAERGKIGTIGRGEAAVTKAFRLPARFIIHTVGPVWQGGNHGEFETLRSCYRKSLLLAEQLGCQSIAFPLISTGIYGFPRDKALEIALSCFREHLTDSEMEITLVVFDRGSVALSASLVDEVEQFIDERYVKRQLEKEMSRDSMIYGAEHERRDAFRRRQGFTIPFLPNARREAAVAREDRRPVEEALGEALFEEPQVAEDAVGEAPQAAPRPAESAKPAREKSRKQQKTSAIKQGSLQDAINNIGETFQQKLLHMIDERSYTDAQVYKKANLDRKLFSKIRCNEAYNPSKKTVLSLALALELNLDETVDLLARAGFALSPSSKADLIIEYCIQNEKYDVMDVDTILFHYGLPTLH